MHPGVPRPTRVDSGEAWVSRLRLASGLVLFAYLTTHFTSHALGLGRTERLAIRVIPDAVGLAEAISQAPGGSAPGG